jgi:ribosomal protein S18 acetylase RimI-like enzyme
VTSIVDIRRIEELSINAWPSLKQALYDGWVLRFAGGYTRRSNSVNPLYPGDLDVNRKIRFCEDAYRDAGLPAVFKMTAVAQPVGLRDALIDSGYREQARTSVQTFELGRQSLNPTGQPSPTDPRWCWNQPSEEWLSAFVRFTPVADERVPVLRAILGGIAPRAQFVAVSDTEGICACGMGVIQDGWLGLFDIVTRPDCRRRGFARQVVDALLDWGRANGAARAYLQVMLDNAPARALYAGIGFREMYQYVYLVRPPERD